MSHIPHSPPSPSVLKNSRITTRIKAAPTESAFTLLEVILAVTIAGALLAGAATLMVSVTNAWLERQDRHFFEDHVDGVTEFLQASFSAAGTEISASATSDDEETDPTGETDINIDMTSGQTGAGITFADDGTSEEESKSSTSNGGTASGASLIQAAEEPISWEKPPGFANFQDPLLHFSLRETPPLLIQAEDAPVIGIKAFLHFEKDEGLSLLWYTPLQEEAEDVNDLRRTPISDLVTEIQYVYWDAGFEKWEQETEPREGEEQNEYLLPRFLKLTFEYEGVTKERTLTIPVPSSSALIF